MNYFIQSQRHSGEGELKLRMEECNISESLFEEMCSVLKVDRKTVILLMESNVGMREFPFLRDSIYSLREFGYSTENMRDTVLENLRNLEIELNEVTDYTVIKPSNINVWPNDENFHDQLMEYQRLDERAREIEERLALPDEERKRLEQEKIDEIKYDIALWKAILHSLDLENQPPKDEKNE